MTRIRTVLHKYSGGFSGDAYGVGSPVKCTLNSPSADTLSMYDNANKRAVCKSAGHYIAAASASSCPQYTILYVYKNGASVASCNGGDGTGPVAAWAELDLAVNDYIEVFVKNDRSGPVTGTLLVERVPTPTYP